MAWARAHPLAADGLLGALLAVVSLIALVFQARDEHPPRPGLLAVALVLLVNLPLAWRRRHPLGVTLAVGAAAVAYGVSPLPDLVTPRAARRRGRLLHQWSPGATVAPR